MKQVFCSCVFEDRAYRTRLEHWAAQGLLGDVRLTGETKDVRLGGSSAIVKHLSPKLTGALALIVFVGQDSHNHDWVAYEVNHMLSSRKLVLPVRIPNTSGAAPESVRGMPLLAFEPETIRRGLGT